MADYANPFAFFTGGNIDPSNMTYNQLLRRQAIAMAAAARSRKMPTTLGEGLTYLGESIGDRMEQERIEKALAGQESDLTRRAAGAPSMNVATPPNAAGRPAGASAPPPTPLPPSVAPRAPSPFDTAPAAPNWRGADAGTPVAADVPPAAAAATVAPPTEAAAAQRANIAAAIENNRNGPEGVPQANPTEGAALLPPSLLTLSADLGGPASTDAAEPQRVSDETQARWQNGIAGIETGGQRDPYGTIGRTTIYKDGTRDQPYGRYQVMGRNVAPWTQAALGKPMTPQQFLADRDAQDAVFNHRFGQYVDRYGEEGAARAWLGGPGSVNNPRARDINGTTVGGYGQDFIRRIGGGARQAAAPGMQIAALTTGDTMSDAPPIMPRIPGATPDENEPTPTDIAPAPRQLLAQAGGAVPIAGGGGGIPASMLPVVSAPGAPAAPPPLPVGAATATGSARAPIPAGVGSPTSERATPPGLAVPIERPVAPDPTPLTPWEKWGQELQQVPRFAGNPQAQALAQQYIDYGKNLRSQLDAKNNAQYNQDMETWRQARLAEEAANRTREERGYQLRSAAAEEQKRLAYGNLPAPVEAKLQKETDNAQMASNSLEGMQNARLAMDAGTVFGLGAGARLAYYRARALAGDPEAARIVQATQTFRTNLGPNVQQAIRAYGGSQISTFELKFGHEMSGADINLDEGTARRVLEIGERAARGQLEYQQQLKDRLLKGQPEALQEVYSIRGAQPPVPIPSVPVARSPDDKAALDWANANPGDPRAAAIKRKLGAP